VTLARAPEHDFAGAGNFETLANGFFCFDTLGTSHNDFFLLMSAWIYVIKWGNFCLFF
jgi:hypothetical protein